MDSFDLQLVNYYAEEVYHLIDFGRTCVRAWFVYMCLKNASLFLTPLLQLSCIL